MELALEHLADLQRSALDHRTIELCGFQTISPSAIHLPGVQSAYSLPYFNMDGKRMDFERWRLFPPVRDANCHTRKYHQAAGSAPHLYLPPLHDWRTIATDPTLAIVFTEGEKKAACACQHGLISIGIGGCWCWCKKD